MNKKPHTPTRTCPHRWCKPLHVAPIPFVLAVVAFDLWHNWIFLVTLTISVAVGFWLPKVVHFKRRPRSTPITLKDVVEDLRESPSAIDLEMQDALYEGTGWRTLEVRKGWARVAVGCDIVLVTLLGLVTTAMFSDPAEAVRSAESASLDIEMFVSLAIGFGFFAFMMYAHKKATQPRKPKRAWVPAFLRTNS